MPLKIGILTYHWSTNHGAVLQAWCLQEYLQEQGHEVDVINYKPRKLDLTWLRIALHPRRWLSLGRQLATRRKEALLVPFRKRYLHLTRRFRSLRELEASLDRYDVLVSGSDQVLNPSFTLHGQDGHPSPAYWLGVGGARAGRIGYAVSFGCEAYPEDAAAYARDWVRRFDVVGVREKTGLRILDQLGYEGPRCQVPDPTLLLGAGLFGKLGVPLPGSRGSYTCVYMLRREVGWEGEVRFIDDRHSPLTVEAWLGTIAGAKDMVTNSYHGMLAALFAHVPVAVLLEKGAGSGMNDRFLTVLDALGIPDRVAWTVREAQEVLRRPIDFDALDAAVSRYAGVGKDFLKDSLSALAEG
jgi:hypothetical protein